MSENQPPNLRLACFLQGDGVHNTFRVEVSSTTSVTVLVTHIIEVYNQSGFGRKLDPEKHHITLFKVDLPRDQLANVEAPPEVDILERMDDVGDYWPDIGQIQRRNVQILLKVDSFAMSLQQTGVDMVSQVSSTLDQLTLRQDKTAEAFRDAPSASAAAHRSAFEKQQEKGIIPIYNGRPYGRTAIPVQLFHPVFDYFTAQLSQKDELSTSKYVAVENLLLASQGLYASEPARWKVIKDLLTAAIGYPVYKDDISRCQSDGVVTFTQKDSAYKAYGIVLELKNEIGTGHSDPWVQAAQSFARYWSEEKMTKIRRATRCPTFIISIAGPWLCISGAVYLDRVVVQPLTDYMWLGRHPQQDHHLLRMTRVFEAIFRAVSELKTYYTPFILPDAHHPIERDRIYPYVQSVQGSKGTINFKYKGVLGGSDVVRPLFEAITEDGKPIVVKFTQFYNFEAHKLLAEKGLAPKLLSLNAQPISAGLVMIVMELFGTSLDTYLDPAGPGLDQSARAHIESDVKMALDLLHTQNLVFGDLRSPNVLVEQDPNGLFHAQLVDFEWCGASGEARYPVGMNPSKRIRWADGMTRGSLLYKEHDDHMLANLFLPPLVKETQ
ncbi:unnamed protein product [Rhizoctonia solani]|uniref:Serine-threonine/tyrosine-protein kinase catalytic domain-containing protein n=1 Tax=Rhizoctonia solani TaxID=456999 RepID=A0A8H3D6U2_9AGAM|nr:unnamed protein product [Rhizoctonia solani]